MIKDVYTELDEFGRQIAKIFLTSDGQDLMFYIGRSNNAVGSYVNARGLLNALIDNIGDISDKSKRIEPKQEGEGDFIHVLCDNTLRKLPIVKHDINVCDGLVMADIHVNGRIHPQSQLCIVDIVTFGKVEFGKVELTLKMNIKKYEYSFDSDSTWLFIHHVLNSDEEE